MANREIKCGFSKYNISYEIIGKGKEIVFLHGWGAKKEIMKKAFEPYFKDYKQVYIDLPGFGASSINKPLNTADYAKIIASFLEEIHINKFCIVGHSFGGKVATLLAPQNLVLLSSAGILNKKSLWVKCKIKIFKIVKFFGLNKFYKFFASADVAGMSRDMYETLKNVVNEDFSNIFANCPSKTMLFWGNEDKATPIKNAEKISKLVKNCACFESFSGDHFFFLMHSQKISNKIHSILEQDINQEQTLQENLNTLNENSNNS